MDWLLLIPYLLLLLFIASLFALTGRMALRLTLGPAWMACPGALRFCFSYGTGLLIFSFLVTLLGLGGLLVPRAVGGLVIALLCLGVAHWVWDRRRTRQAARPARLAREEARMWPWAKAAIVAYGLFLAAWITVGAAAPDMSQDPMWYHLTVSRAWAHRGDVVPFLYNMPSNYALGFEAVYAALQLFSNEVACSLLYSQQAIMIVLTVIFAAGHLYGRLTGWIAAALALTLYASSTIRVPIGALNDFAAAFLLLLSLLALLVPGRIFATGRGGWREGAVAGALAGGAASFKIVSAGFLAPCVALMAVWHAFRPRSRSHEGVKFSFFAAFLIAAAVAYGPWAYRNVAQGCGNPLFPLALFHLSCYPEYEHVARASADLNRVFQPTPAGVWEALQDLRRRLHFFLTDPDILGTMLPILITLGLAFGSNLTRRLCAVLLLQCGVLLMMHGWNELVRYFALCYPLAVVVAAALFVEIMKKRPQARRILTVGLLAILAGGALTHWRKQIRWMTYKTIAWPGHPVLTPASRAAYAVNKEAGGQLLVPFGVLSKRLPQDARVLLPDCHYPYYLDRYYFWSGEVTPNIVEHAWAGFDLAQAADWLTERGVPHVVYVREPSYPLIKKMLETGVLKRVFFGEDDALMGSIRVFRFDAHGPAARTEFSRSLGGWSGGDS